MLQFSADCGGVVGDRDDISVYKNAPSKVRELVRLSSADLLLLEHWLSQPQWSVLPVPSIMFCCNLGWVKATGVH
jgi:hypothetical protein